MRNFLFKLFLCCTLAGLGSMAWAADGKTELTWYGHAAFKIVTPKGHVLFLDPWLVNPLNPDGKEDLAKIDRADLILISHGHFDHVGNASEIAQKTGARLVSTFDLGNAMITYGGYPKEQMGYDSQGNFGGTLSFFENEVKIAFVPAIHSSALNPKQMGLAETESLHTAGNPGGFVIMIENGPTFYHTGDTDFFSDMKLVSQFKPIDVMLACIGDHFTMGPDRAALAVQAVNPKRVVPMHFGTFPDVLPGSVEAFRAALLPLKLENKLHPVALEKTVVFEGAELPTP